MLLVWFYCTNILILQACAVHYFDIMCMYVCTHIIVIFEKRVVWLGSILWISSMEFYKHKKFIAPNVSSVVINLCTIMNKR